jgi:hypothetical protein
LHTLLSDITTRKITRALLFKWYQYSGFLA